MRSGAVVALCECGCGEAAPIADATNSARGYVKGEPRRFVSGHQARGRAVQPLAERFWSKVDRGKADECWEWTAGRFKAGYGAFARTRELGPAYAHRMAYELTYGPIPDGMDVCHTCDNPPCCNPAHHFLGTHGDNMADMSAKGRAAGARGERHRSARLTREQVMEARRRFTGARGEIIALARAYGVSDWAMSQALHGVTWRHVPGAKPGTA